MAKQIQAVAKKKTTVNALSPTVVGETVSLCPVCLERLPAQKVAYGSRVYMEKTCPDHGAFRTLLWQGRPSYEEWQRQEKNDKPTFQNTPVELGCPYDCGICGQHKQDICCVLFQLTERCNQHCPFCFAGSGEAEREKDMTMAQIEGLYDFLIEKSPSHPYNIQLSGGEPTMREDLAEIIAMGKAKGFTYIQLNTNGKKLAASQAYADTLKEAGLDCVYLQFDGMKDSVYQEIRGEALLATKRRAIRHCQKAGIGVVLVMTLVPGANIQEIGPVLDFAIQNIPAVRGVSLQPVSYLGRYPKAPKDSMRITMPQVLREIEGQTHGKLKQNHFVPLVSGDCYCSFHGNFLVTPENEIIGVSSDENRPSCCGSRDDRNAIIQAREFIADKFRASKYQAGGNEEACDFESWDLFIKQANTRGFCVTCETFQDVWNFDALRTQKCRLYIGTPDQKLIPFCVYNLTDTEGRFLYGGCR